MIYPHRPPKYNNPQEMQAKIDEYFALCEPKILTYTDEETGEERPMLDSKGQPVYTRKPPTKSGLALYLGFCDRRSLYDYEKKKGFSYIIKRVKAQLSDHHETGLDKDKCSGHIFWLKCDGWNDKAGEQQEAGDDKIVIEIDWGKDEAKSE